MKTELPKIKIINIGGLQYQDIPVLENHSSIRFSLPKTIFMIKCEHMWKKEKSPNDDYQENKWPKYYHLSQGTMKKGF